MTRGAAEAGRGVLVAGSLHHDIMVEASHLPRRDETAVGARWYPKFGGKGGNQALALARAGVRVRMLGAVGRDDFGAFLRAGLRGAGVDDRFVATVEAGSGMSVAILDPSGDYAATIVSGANLSVALPASEALWQDIGLVLLQNEIPEATNRAVAEAARARRIPVLLNAAPARDLGPDLAELVDLLVVNAVEAEMMGAGPVRDLGSACRAAATLSGRFASVIVTAGGQGLAAAWGGGDQLSLPAERVRVVSTHGAGDAFIGALGAALVRGQAFDLACQAASRAAARHVSAT